MKKWTTTTTPGSYRYIWIILNAIYVRRYLLFYFMNVYELNSVRRTRNNSNYSKRYVSMYLLTWYWQYLYPVCHKSFEHKAKSIKKEQKNTEGPKRFHFALTYLQTVIFFRQILLWNMEIWIRSLSLSLPHRQHRRSSFFLAPSENSFCIQNKNVLLFTRYMNVYIIFFYSFF